MGQVKLVSEATKEDLEAALAALDDPEPQLYCGYTEEQWQFVIDGKFDVKVSNLNASKTSERPYITLLTGLSPIQEDKFIIKDVCAGTSAKEAMEAV